MSSGDLHAEVTSCEVPRCLFNTEAVTKAIKALGMLCCCDGAASEHSSGAIYLYQRFASRSTSELRSGTPSNVKDMHWI